MEQTLEIKKTKNYYDHVFENCLISDIEIVMKNKTLKVHKQILGKQNSVFLNQILSQPKQKKIEILDLDPIALEVFINYLYTGKISARNITAELLLVAHRYMDSTLGDVCRERLSKSLSVKNAARRLLTFLKCRENNLFEETCWFVAENFNDVKNQLGFKKVLENSKAISALLDIFGNFLFKFIKFEDNLFFQFCVWFYLIF